MAIIKAQPINNQSKQSASPTVTCMCRRHTCQNLPYVNTPNYLHKNSQNRPGKYSSGIHSSATLLSADAY